MSTRISVVIEYAEDNLATPPFNDGDQALGGTIINWFPGDFTPNIVITPTPVEVLTKQYFTWRSVGLDHEASIAKLVADNSSLVTEDQVRAQIQTSLDATLVQAQAKATKL